MKIYLLVGETSGDVHGSELVQSILSIDPSTEIRAMGGPLMESSGAKIAFDYRQFAIMGFIEVLKNIGKIKKHLKNVERDILAFQPDKVLMIDFPGFNLNLAKRLNKKIPLYYYIAPKAWAWNAKRSYKLAKYFKKVFCILPFEIEFFNSYHVNAEYVGNPSKDQVDRYIEQSNSNNKTTSHIAIFPGSRKQEVERILPIMLDAIRLFPDIKYKISQAPALDKSIYLPFLKEEEDLIQENYKLLHGASAALVTSGTATLETALFNVPQIVCYVGNSISIKIAKFLVKIKFISLVNLIMDKEVIKELIQEECSAENIQSELKLLLQNPEKLEMIRSDYKTLRAKLGNQKASQEVANSLMRN